MISVKVHASMFGKDSKLEFFFLHLLLRPTCVFLHVVVYSPHLPVGVALVKNDYRRTMVHRFIWGKFKKKFAVHNNCDKYVVFTSGKLV